MPIGPCFENEVVADAANCSEGQESRAASDAGLVMFLQEAEATEGWTLLGDPGRDEN